MNEYNLDCMLLGSRVGMNMHRYAVNGKVSGNLAAIHDIYKAVPILYGPKGCGFHYRYGARSRSAVFHELECVDVKEAEVIFGGREKLREVVLRVDREQKPELIFLLPTVVSDVINEDLEGYAEELQEEVKAKLVNVSSQVFSHMDKTNVTRRIKEKAAQGSGNERKACGVSYEGCGYVEVMDSIVNQVMEPQELKNKSVNIETFIWGYDSYNKLSNMKKMLNKMGVEVNCFLPACTLATLKKAPAAALNIVRRKKWAVAMQRRFGTDYLQVSELQAWHGFEGIGDFYRSIGEKLGLQEAAETMIAEEMTRVKPRYEELKQSFSKQRFCLITGNLDGLPAEIELYQKDYGLILNNICLIMSPNYQKLLGLDDGTMAKMKANVEESMKRVGCEAELYINPELSAIKGLVHNSDFIICGANPAYSSIGLPIIPTDINRAVFDFDSFMDIMEEISRRLEKPTINKGGLLLNRVKYDRVYFPMVSEDAASIASREMFSRMWRMRRK